MRIPKHDESCQTSLGVDFCISFRLGPFFTGVSGVETAPVPFSASSNRLVVKTFLVKLLFLLDLEAAKQPRSAKAG